MRSFFIAIILFFAASLPAQGYMEKIANETCSCSKLVPDSLETQRSYLELGSCMLKAAEPYRKQLKKDHAIDLDDIENGAKNLGKIVGMKMATICPDMLMKFGQKKKETQKLPEAEFFQGRITRIEKDFFVIFSVNDNAGKSLKFYWLTNAESNIELVNQYEQLFDKDVKVKYHIMSLFDAKINDYRNFNVIDKIEQLSR